MTQKELLYLEDAIGHENSIISICNSISSSLTDSNLKEFIDSNISIHQSILGRLETFLEGKANE